MKKGILCMMVLALLAFPAWADEVDNALGIQATEQVRASTRAMIQAGINSDDVIKMTQAMIQNRFRNEFVIQAHKTVMQAQQEELPTSPVINKVHEGIAKKVSDGQIVKAMEQTRLRYAFAYTQASRITQDSEEKKRIGNMLAESMAAGVSQADVKKIMDRLQTRTRDMKRAEAKELSSETCQTVREMARKGFGSDACTTVCQALQNRYTARQMKQMRENQMFNIGGPQYGGNGFGQPGGSGPGGSGSGSGSGDSGSGGSGGSGSGGSGSGGGHGNGGSGGGSGSGGGK